MQLAFFEFDPQARAISENVEVIVAGCAKLKRALVALPELFLSSYQTPEPIAEGRLADVLAPLSRLTRENHLCFVGSLPVQVEKGLVNRAVIIRNGGVETVYDKQRPFGTEKETFVAGDERPRMHSFYNATFSVQVCFDNVSPVPSRDLARSGMDVLIAPSTVSVRYLRDILRTRALENQIITVFCNRTGEEADSTWYCGASAIFFPDGSAFPARGRRRVGPKLVATEPPSNFFAHLERRRVNLLGDPES